MTDNNHNMIILSKSFLGFTVFICGAMVMIFELVGSRVLGPYLGTSIYVWTSLIGVIMGSLSLGYWLGGKYADKNPSLQNLATIIFVSGLLIIIVNIFREHLLSAIDIIKMDTVSKSLIASLALFFIPSTFLGMVSPYAAKLKLNSLNTSGSTVGNLYALSTLGSIVGTFMAGYWLIPSFGTQKIIYGIGTVLMLNSLLIAVTRHTIQIALASAGILLLLFAPKSSFDFDSMYSRIWIYETNFGANNEKILAMRTDSKSIQSAMFLNSDEFVLEYSKYFRLGSFYNKSINEALVIGGAGYTYPKDFLKNFPEAKLDVVEIDPKMTELAKKYFNLKEDPRLTIYHEDSRIFLNNTTKKYDAIYVDAFGAITVPYQLTTVEFVEKMKNALNPGGVVIINTISSIEGTNNKFLLAEYKTYNQVFPQVKVFPVSFPVDTLARQNIVYVALNSDKITQGESSNPQINLLLSREWKKPIDTSEVPVLTDDYAPVESYIKNLY